MSEWKRYDKERPTKEGEYIVMDKLGKWTKKQYVKGYKFKMDSEPWDGFIMNSRPYKPDDSRAVAWLEIPPCPYLSKQAYDKLLSQKERLEENLKKITEKICEIDASDIVEITTNVDDEPKQKSTRRRGESRKFLIEDGEVFAEIIDDDDEEENDDVR